MILPKGEFLLTLSFFHSVGGARLLDKQTQPIIRGKKKMCPLSFRVTAGGKQLDSTAVAEGIPGEHELQAEAHRNYRSAFLQGAGECESGFE